MISSHYNMLKYSRCFCSSLSWFSDHAPDQSVHISKIKSKQAPSFITTIPVEGQSNATKYMAHVTLRVRIHTCIYVILHSILTYITPVKNNYTICIIDVQIFEACKYWGCQKSSIFAVILCIKDHQSFKFLNQVCSLAASPGFLELLLFVCMCVCVCPRGY